MTKSYKLDTCKENSPFDCIPSNPTDLREMPATHKQDWYLAEKTLDYGRIELTECDVFGESLAYFFYGRPSYCAHQKKGYRGDESYFPVCFILDMNAIHID